MRVTIRLFCYFVIVGLPVNSWTNPSLSTQSTVSNTATPRPNYNPAPKENEKPVQQGHTENAQKP